MLGSISSFSEAFGLVGHVARALTAAGSCVSRWPFLPQRPTAKELLKHKLIMRHAKKTSYLTELIDRYRRWKAEKSREESSSDESDS